MIVVRSRYTPRNCLAGLKKNTKNLRIPVVFERDSNLRTPDHKAEVLNTTLTCCVLLVLTDELQIVY